MRRAVSILLAAVLVASCSGGSSDDASGPTTPPEATTPADTVDAPATVAPTTIPETVPPTVPLPAGDTAYDQLAALEADESVSHIEVALAELTSYVGPIPGVPTLDNDGSIYPSLTHVLLDLEVGRDELTPEQAAAVDAGIDQIFPPDEIIDEFALFPDDDGGVQGFAPRGFASTAAAPAGDDPPLSDAPAVLRREVLAWAARVREYLGGPTLNIWVQTYPYGTVGDVAGRNRGLEPSDERRTAERGNPDCLIQLAIGSTADDIAGIVAHEITHCWQFTRLGLDAGRMNATGRWVIEGQAAYVGHVIGGLTRFNDNWWQFYLDRVDENQQWNLYRGSYDAIGFWARIAAGSDEVAAMRRTLDAATSDSAMLAAATSDLGLAWLGAGTFQRSDWGGGWTAAGAGDPGTPRPAGSHTVIERNDVALSADAGAQANHEIEVLPVDGADGSVTAVQGRGAGVIRAGSEDVVLSGAFDEEWCIGECVCPDGSPAFPADRTRTDALMLAASLVGLPSDSTTLNVRVGEFDPESSEACEEEEEEDPALPPPPDGDIGGLIGTWRANPNAVAQAFEQSSGFGAEGDALDIAGVTGDVLLTFDEGGSGTLSYVDVTIFINDAVLGDVTLNGAGTFNWTIEGASVVISGTDYAISVGSSALGGEILTITDEDVPATGSTRLSGAVAGDMLTITSADGSAGAVFFPISWVRQ